MDFPEYWPDYYPNPVDELSIGSYRAWIEINGRRVPIFPLHDGVHPDRVVDRCDRANDQVDGWFQSIHLAEFCVGLVVPSGKNVLVDVFVDGELATELYIRAGDEQRIHLIRGSSSSKNPNIIQPFKLHVPGVITLDSDDDSDHGSVIDDYVGLIEIWMRSGYVKKSKGKRGAYSASLSGTMTKAIGERCIHGKQKAVHDHVVSYGPERTDDTHYEPATADNFITTYGGTRFFTIQYNSEEMLVAHGVIPTEMERLKAQVEGLQRDLAVAKAMSPNLVKDE